MDYDTEYFDMEEIIERTPELREFIVNDCSKVLKKGDFVICSYLKKGLYKVVGRTEFNKALLNRPLSNKIILENVDTRLRYAIGEQFLKRVDANNESINILYNK